MTSNLDWALPEGLEVPRDELLIRLDIYTSSLLLHTYEQGVTTTKQVSPAGVALALSRDLQAASGLLPVNTLWWKNSRNGPLVALWCPPKIRQLAMQDEAFKPPTRLRAPMPGAIFLCSPGQAPWVFACKRKPKAATDRVYRMPCFNVFRQGRVCPGTHSFSPRVAEIPDEFFLSFFSHTGDFGGRSKSHPEDLRAFWQELDGKKRFPTDDLVPDGHVGNVMELP